MEGSFKKLDQRKLLRITVVMILSNFLYNTFRSGPESIVWEGCSLEVAYLFFIRTEQMEPCGLDLHVKTVVCVYFSSSSVKVISSKSKRN